MARKGRPGRRCRQRRTTLENTGPRGVPFVGLVLRELPAPAWPTRPWLDQELVRLSGVTLHSAATTVTSSRPAPTTAPVRRKDSRKWPCSQSTTRSSSEETLIGTPSTWRSWTPPPQTHALISRQRRTPPATAGSWPGRANMPLATRVWALEGTGSFGAGLRRSGRGRRGRRRDRPGQAGPPGGEERPARCCPRGARALAREVQASPRERGLREALRVGLATRHAVLVSRTKAINELKALIVVAPEYLRPACEAGPSPTS